MSFGTLTTRRADGSILMDGLSRGGVLIDILTCPAGQNGSKSYPRTHQAGLSYFYARAGGHTITQKDQLTANGIQGTIVWNYTVSAPQTDTILYVFAKQLDSVDLYGLKLWNDVNEVLVDSSYSAPQFAGTIQLNQTARLTYTTPDGYAANVHSATVNIRPGSDKMVMLYLPDSGANDTWYRLPKENVLARDGVVSVDVVVYTKASSYALPSLHIYALNAPVQSGETYSIRVRDAAQNLTFDSGVECFTRKDELQISFTGYGFTSTYTLPAGVLGLTIPYFQTVKTVATSNWFDELYYGAAKRVGSQYTYTVLLDRRINTVNRTQGSYSIGGTSQRYSPVADVSHVSPSNIPGIPTTASTAPTITNDLPSIAYSQPGAVKTYTFGVTGTPAPTYKWFRNGVEIPGQVGASYSFSAQNSNDGDTYYCIATNSMDFVKSTVSTFYIDTSQPPYLVSSSGGGTYHAGATVNVSVQGGGNPTPTVRLYHGGKVAEGTPTANYQFTMPALPYGSDTGYVVSYEISNQGEHIGNVVTGQIRFQSYEYSDFTPVSLTSSPQTQTVNAGDTVTMSAAFSGSLPMRTICYRNGQQYAYGLSVTFTASAADNGSTWNFHASNGNGTTDFVDGQYTANSSTATLTVRAPVGPATPVFDQQPSDQYITSGQNASFSCHASPANRYQWYQNNAQMSGQTGSSISLPARDTGWNLVEFYCVAFNDTANGTGQNQSSTAVLHVAPAAAPTTYTGYVNGSPYVDSQTGTVSWFAGGDYTDSGAWHNNSAGDNSLYDVQATSASGTSEGAALNTWYSMSGGASWYITANSIARTKRLSFTYQIRLRSSGSIVSSGTVSLTSTYGVAG